MNKIKAIKKNYLFSGLLVAFIIIISILLYPLYNNIIILNQEIHDKRIQLAIYQQQRSNLEKSRRDYNKIRNDIVNISRIFIDKERILDLVDIMESIAMENSIIQNINISNTDQLETNDSLTINITLIGNWPNIITYLGDLEKLDYYLTLNDLNFKQDNDEIVLNFTTTVYTYSF